MSNETESAMNEPIQGVALRRLMRIIDAEAAQ